MALVGLLILRGIVSVAGLVGNVMLIQALLKLPRLKTFELFLLGLAFSNVEELLIVEIYDIIVVLFRSQISRWVCRTLKFLTILGEIGSITFTVLISSYRYQKLRDAEQRVNKPILMDSTRAAYAFAWASLLFAFLLAVPTYVTNLDGHLGNLTYNSSCPPDFFQCPPDNCPLLNALYKYLFILLCNLLPLLIITWTSCLIIRVLIAQQRAVHARLATQIQSQQQQQPKFRLRTSKFQQSTVAILVAMVVFQVDWTLYLMLHLAFSPYTFSGFSEFEFFITTSYTTISPYVYGVGINLLSCKTCKRCDG
ncbi:neuropeptides B/W receptor type 1 [Alosa sapidissima]|uniref:neuropeptides B/W receptor type 1 n=1 Tax=Alosa sapidissima TaxID=34773 RepID=UPI001C091324|nr:neuropeptides B/W receptor type 1 [Alosa sapidissima]